MTATITAKLPAAVLNSRFGRAARKLGQQWVAALTADYSQCVLTDGLPVREYVDALSTWEGGLASYLDETGYLPEGASADDTTGAPGTMSAEVEHPDGGTTTGILATQRQSIPTGRIIRLDPQAATAQQLREGIAREYGFNPPMSWNAEQLRACYLGLPGAAPRSREDVRLAAIKLRGYAPPKSWSVDKMWEYAHGRREQRGAAFKASAVAKYAKAFDGAAPPKSWTAAKIAAAVVAGTPGKPGVSRPGTGGFGGKRADGLTADKCRELIKAGLASGRITAEQAKGRSAWKADQLREFVTQHNLTVAA